MSDSIEVICANGQFSTPHSSECEFVSDMTDHCLTRYYRIIRLLMLAGFCIVAMSGCATRDELASLKQSLRTTETRCEENTTALAAIKASLEASEVPDSVNGKEVISVENEPQTATDGNGSQTLKSQPEQVAAVRLFVTHAPFNCPPCDAFDRAVARGDLAGFEVIASSGFDGLQSYPAIRFEWAGSATGWAVRYGWSADQLAWLKRNLLPAKESLLVTAMSHSEMKALHDQLHGGNFSWTWPGGTTESLAEHLRTTHGVPVNELDQNYRASAIVSPRVSLRSATRRRGDNWKSRTSYRVACPPGRSS
jgi:hypothetical protein